MYPLPDNGSFGQSAAPVPEAAGDGLLGAISVPRRRKVGSFAVETGRREFPQPRATHAHRLAFTASLSTCSTASESSQPMQPSVMLWP
jgi:hypothetical protein